MSRVGDWLSLVKFSHSIFALPFALISLLLATGAGALSRQSIGAVVFFGVTCSMLLTLIVVPTVYGLIARNTHSPEYVAHLIEKLSAKAQLSGTAKS